MQFTLRTFFLLFVVLWSSLAVFGVLGCATFVVVLGMTAVLNGRTRACNWFVVPSLLVVMLVVLLIPSIRNAREAARTLHCQGNLAQLRLALENYCAAHGCYPPAYLADKNGKPMHSWRVLILPFIESGLHTRYNPNEPWDGPNNKKLLAERPSIFKCPSADILAGDGVTTDYAFVVGKNAFWTPQNARDPKTIADPGKTPILIEVADSNIKWTEPRDFNLDDLRPDGSSNGTRLSAQHSYYKATIVDPGGCHVAFLHGYSELLRASATTTAKLRAWLSVNSYNEAEVATITGVNDSSINWTNCAALTVWIASVALLFYRAWRGKEAKMKPVQRDQRGEIMAGS